MHKIYFYRDRKGKRPVVEYMKELRTKKDKSSRIRLEKINDYIQTLSEYGLAAKEPYLKHLDGDIWELRPLKSRILFVAWINGSFVLLHPFTKKTQKTPKKEIEKAKREVADLLERGMQNG